MVISLTRIYVLNVSFKEIINGVGDSLTFSHTEVIRNHLYSKEACEEKQGIILTFKGVLHPWALFLKTLCIFLKNKTTLDEVSYGSGQECSKELKNHSFPSVVTIVVKLQ